ncbi:MAG: cytochrome c oxidase assembly protein [Actinomycetota bacterium]|nr:cytochrome c oxidase assembly protein [Actinomycetota bacterium]
MLVAAVRFPHWHAHFDVWALLGAIVLLYVGALRGERARRPGESVVTRAQWTAFAAGMGLMWLASDWPVHDVAEGYLYSVHMLQHLLFTLAAAPLLLLGTPAWMARRILGSGRRLRAVRAMSRPVTGLIQFNIILVASHWPLVVQATVQHHPLHFAAHAVLLTSAVLMWMPVVSPLREIPRAKPPTQMLYLFLQTIVPTVPASFLTFNSHPLYKIYATFPRLWGISALTDQQLAGLIMKIVGGLYLWLVIAVVFFRWNESEERRSSEGGVLLWDDVEEELLTPPQPR